MTDTNAYLKQGLVRDYPLTIRHVTGSTTDVLYNATLYRNDAGQIQGVFAAARDITELKAADRRRDFTKALLKLFAKKTSLKEYLDSVLQVIQDWAGCQALGIRIVDAEKKIPYGSCHGFSQDFLQLESNLSLASDNCLCIRAIAHKFEDQDCGILTSGGSFRCDDGPDFVSRLSVKIRPFIADTVSSSVLLPCPLFQSPIATRHSAQFTWPIPERRSFLRQPWNFSNPFRRLSVKPFIAFARKKNSPNIAAASKSW